MEPGLRFALFLRLALVAALAGLAAACASERYQTATLVENHVGSIAPTAHLAVAVAGDGRYINKPYSGSGDLARAAMTAALSRHADAVFEVPGHVPADAAGAGALGREVDYIVYLKILHWEERATEWSGKPDQVEVEIRLLNGKDGAVLGSRRVKANSSWMTLGGDHPQDLLMRPFDAYAAELFGAAHPTP